VNVLCKAFLNVLLMHMFYASISLVGIIVLMMSCNLFAVKRSIVQCYLSG